MKKQSKVRELMVALLALAAAAPAMAIEKSEREVLVVANLVTNGDPRFAWLYQFLNASAVTGAQAALGLQYRAVRVLAGSNATKSAFTQTIANLTASPSLKALDVIVALHGSPETLHFQDGGRSMSSIQTGLGNGANSKLRMLYSTACYGSSHADNFVSGGFKVATGARAVNANSPYEYPVVLGGWALGSTMAEVTALGNDAVQRGIYDSAARMAGFTDVDSFKVIRGIGTTRIHSSAL
jgi:hypothetical protein